MKIYNIFNKKRRNKQYTLTCDLKDRFVELKKKKLSLDEGVYEQAFKLRVIQ